MTRVKTTSTKPDQVARSLQAPVRLPPRRFMSENSGFILHEPQPWYRPDPFEWKYALRDGWKVVGWCENTELGLMARKDYASGMIAMLFESPDGEEVWFHAHRSLLNTLQPNTY